MAGSITVYVKPPIDVALHVGQRLSSSGSALRERWRPLHVILSGSLEPRSGYASAMDEGGSPISQITCASVPYQRRISLRMPLVAAMIPEPAAANALRGGRRKRRWTEFTRLRLA